MTRTEEVLFTRTENSSVFAGREPMKASGLFLPGGCVHVGLARQRPCTADLRCTMMSVTAPPPSKTRQHCGCLQRMQQAAAKGGDVRRTEPSQEDSGPRRQKENVLKDATEKNISWGLLNIWNKSRAALQSLDTDSLFWCHSFGSALHPRTHLASGGLSYELSGVQTVLLAGKTLKIGLLPL